MNTVLPRVLSTTRRSGGLDAEREEFERTQAAAVLKAINAHENPVKEKHVRTCILGTHRERGSGTFWSNVHKVQLEGNPIVCWKFCHVLHKLLRDGHAHVISDSLKYKSKLNDLAKLWGHLKEGYGQMIMQYSKLLITKLNFHQKNPRIPGNLVLTDEELETIGEKDVNMWFELSVEMLDYLDDINALQKAVFDSMDMARSNSMTTSGQCRLAPLILCILDSSCLYDYVVKMLFKLHSTLHVDVLGGHRDRFNVIFKSLKRFYYNSSNLQYFKNLISIPPLPESPPNFLMASAFDDYVTPEVRMFDQGSEYGADTPPDSRSVAESPLVDIEVPKQLSKQLNKSNDKFNDAFGNSSFDGFAFSGQNGDDSRDKERIINSLKADLEDSKGTLQRLNAQHAADAEQLQRRLSVLEQQLHTSRELIDQISEENERYKEQAEAMQNERNQTTATRFEEAEKKVASSEEKFKKMKDIYGKLREEHIEHLKKESILMKEKEQLKKDLEESQYSFAKTQQEFSQLRLLLTETQNKDAESSLIQQQLLQTTKELEQFRLKYEDIVSQHQAAHVKLTEEVTQLQRLREDERQSSASSLRDFSLNILDSLCSRAVFAVNETMEQYENPAHLGATCSPEYLSTRLQPCLESVSTLRSCFASSIGSCSVTDDVCSGLLLFSNHMCHVLIHAKAAANIAPIDQTTAIVTTCTELAQKTVLLFQAIPREGRWPTVDNQFTEVTEQLQLLEGICHGLLGRVGDVKADELGSLIDREMKAMDQAIKDAAKKIQDILAKSRQTDTGIKLEVNERIFDSCNLLMQAVMVLVQRSRDLQNEIVVQGRGTGSAQDFYKRNHQWTEGLLSAAKAIGLGATVLVESADKVACGRAKLEELVVASQEIAASTAQLVVSSKVKADRESEKLLALSSASRQVTAATATVVGNVKAGAETLEAKESLDFSKLSLHQAKRQEMDSQVRVLELEQLLQKERMKLAELRKRHYQLAGPSEGWEQQDSS